MGADPIIAPQRDSHRYAAVLRISELIAACREPDELARTLADEIGKFLQFDHLYFIVLKENSKEIEYHVWGKGPILSWPDLPIEELPLWEAVRSRDPLHTPDWDTEKRFPRFKEWAKKLGLGSGVRIPLTTPHRRLGVFGINRDTVNPFTEEEISFLHLIGRVVAFALDDGLNLRRSQQHNERLKLLLNLTSRITSNLKFRELLREIAANIRKVIQADAAGIAFYDAESAKSRMYVVDFPNARGFVKEEILVTPGDAFMRAWESCKPVTLTVNDRKELGTEIHELVVAEGLKAHCLIPLVSHDRPVGVLVLARRGEGFTHEDVDFLREASGQIAIAIENALAYHEISELKDKLAQEKLYLEEEIRSEMNFENIIGNSPPLKHVLELVETVATSDSTVLLLGETGTGKELIARAIHDRSRRKERTFVKLNCAAIPTGLLESELFGHEKGAFTGAIAQKLGRMELADQGTLFLDEVGDIPIEIQPKLLRALQEREFERLGSTHTRRANIRLVAATNRDLEQMIAAREFRSDLYYRLHVFPIRIPPLRERKEDIPQLVSYFVQKFAKQMQKKIEAISPAVMKGLTAWDWPGNIRELENFIERAVIVTRGKSLEAPIGELRKTNTVAFPHAEQHNVEQVAGERTDSQSDQTSVADEYEKRQRDQIIGALTACKGRVGGADGAAASLGMNRTTFLSRMKKFGIYAKQYA
jgi:formate hydrogenlyase transcriptional activator